MFLEFLLQLSKVEVNHIPSSYYVRVYFENFLLEFFKTIFFIFAGNCIFQFLVCNHQVYFFIFSIDAYAIKLPRFGRFYIYGGNFEFWMEVNRSDVWIFVNFIYSFRWF